MLPKVIEKIRTARPSDLRILDREDCGTLLVIEGVPGFVVSPIGGFKPPPEDYVNVPLAEHYSYENGWNRTPIRTPMSEEVTEFLRDYDAARRQIPIIREYETSQDDRVERQEQALERACEEGQISGAMPADF